MLGPGASFRHGGGLHRVGDRHHAFGLAAGVNSPVVLDGHVALDVAVHGDPIRLVVLRVVRDDAGHDRGHVQVRRGHELIERHGRQRLDRCGHDLIDRHRRDLIDTELGRRLVAGSLGADIAQRERYGEGGRPQGGRVQP